MNCPKCSNTALMNLLGQLDFCPSCQGTWFDKGETAKYFSLDQDIPDLAASLTTAEKKGLSCPRCSSELAELKYDVSSDLLLDRCTECEGLWFDAEEVDKLMKMENDKEDSLTRMAKIKAKLRKDRGEQEE